MTRSQDTDLCVTWEVRCRNIIRLFSVSSYIFFVIAFKTSKRLIAETALLHKISTMVLLSVSFSDHIQWVLVCLCFMRFLRWLISVGRRSCTIDVDTQREIYGFDFFRDNNQRQIFICKHGSKGSALTEYVNKNLFKTNLFVWNKTSII